MEGNRYTFCPGFRDELYPVTTRTSTAPAGAPRFQQEELVERLGLGGLVSQQAWLYV